MARRSRLTMMALLVMTIGLLDAAQAPGQAGRGGPAPPPEPNPTAPLYRHTGEQYRIYNFPGTGESIPYRLFVPTTWTPDKKLPMLVTLRAGNTVDGPYRAGNDLVKQAAQRGYIVVTPMGYRGLSQPYYGSRYPIARATPSVPAAGWTPQEDERAEEDVLHVMNLVTKDTTSTRRACICTARIRLARARSTWPRSIPNGLPRSSSAQGRSSSTPIRSTS